MQICHFVFLARKIANTPIYNILFWNTFANFAQKIDYV